MINRNRAKWRAKEEGDYDANSYNLVVGIGEEIADTLEISEQEVYVVSANNHSLNVATEDSMEMLYDSLAPTLEDVKNTDGSKLMHLKSGQPSHDIDGMLTTVPHEQQRSSHYMWFTTTPDKIVNDTGKKAYKPSMDTESGEEYEARLSLSSYPLEEETVEKEIDSAMNRIRKMLGKEPNSEEITEVTSSGLEAILESPDSKTERIVSEVNLKNLELYEDPRIS